jgi:glycosyltransferase involved in cell wall biosynthesis
MKVFFMTTHCNQGTGYARVANKITNYLVSIPGVEVVFYAFQNYPGQDIKDRFIDPRIKFYDALVEDPDAPKGFGDAGIVPAIIKEKPDVLFLYNDMMVTSSLMELIPPEHMPPKKIVYLDVVYPWQDVKIYNKIKKFNFDTIWVFLECWKKHLIEDIGFDSKLVSVLPHGVDFDRFMDIPQGEAKEKMGFKPDDFLILNMNRNSVRKCWETTIKSFLELLKRQNMDPSIKLYCGCMMKTEDGCDIPNVIYHESVRRGLDPETVLNKHVFLNPTPTYLADSGVNEVYNAADVGMNTCCGEGFGLTTLEHAYFNRPQIVSGVPALKETLGEYANVVEPMVWILTHAMEKHMGDMGYSEYTEFTDYLEYYFKHREDRPQSREYVKEKYSWENVYKVLDQSFRK